MHFNGDNSCVKLGSKIKNQIALFGGQSCVRIFSRPASSESHWGTIVVVRRVCILRASFCRFLVGFRHSRVLTYIRNCR